MRTQQQLLSDLARQKEIDDTNKEFVNGREFQVTPEELIWFGSRLMGYDLVTRKPQLPQCEHFIVHRSTGGTIKFERTK